jgi:NAD(P)-dependent dehydrogenase (short-subunit alcohol dehydrogenase family)
VNFFMVSRARPRYSRGVNLEGKTALVTGGAVRIGRAIGEALAGEGCNVIVHCNTSRSAARQLVQRLRAGGVGAWAVQARLRGESDCERLMARAVRVAGKVDILVNNAAVFHKHGLRDTSEARLMTELRINALVPVFLTRSFARRLARGAPGPAGKVVNLLDRRIAGGGAGCLPYLLSKKMLAEFTAIAALELAPGITVNAVAPGPVLPPAAGSRSAAKEPAGTLPLGRRIAPRDVAMAVIYLLQSDAVTGQVIFVDGGQHLTSPA